MTTTNRITNTLQNGTEVIRNPVATDLEPYLAKIVTLYWSELGHARMGDDPIVAQVSINSVLEYYTDLKAYKVTIEEDSYALFRLHNVHTVTKQLNKPPMISLAAVGGNQSMLINDKLSHVILESLKHYYTTLHLDKRWIYQKYGHSHSSWQQMDTLQKDVDYIYRVIAGRFGIDYGKTLLLDKLLDRLTKYTQETTTVFLFDDPYDNIPCSQCHDQTRDRFVLAQSSDAAHDIWYMQEERLRGGRCGECMALHLAEQQIALRQEEDE